MSNTQTNQKQAATSGNKPQEIARRPRFSEAVKTPEYQDLILSTLGNQASAQRFIAAITSAVAITPGLQACTPLSILSGALVGESLKLSPNPTIGHYYLVPRKSKAKYRGDTLIEAECMKASYQTGYKGFIQLGLRSGQYRRLIALEVKQGELISYNPFTEELHVNPIMDANKRMAAPTIGYYVFFELTSGFQKAMYWTYEQMLAHANRYSDAFSAKDFAAIKAGKIDEKDIWKYSSNWYKDFDQMGRKTMIRQLIPVYGPMSIEMQTAFDMDDQVITTDGKNLIPEAIEGVNEALNDFAAESASAEPVSAPEQAASAEPEVVDIDKL